GGGGGGCGAARWGGAGGHGRSGRASSGGPTPNTSCPPRGHARALLTATTCCPTPGHWPVRARRRLPIDPPAVTARRVDLERCREVPHRCSPQLDACPLSASAWRTEASWGWLDSSRLTNRGRMLRVHNLFRMTIIYTHVLSSPDQGVGRPAAGLRRYCERLLE